MSVPEILGWILLAVVGLCVATVVGGVLIGLALMLWDRTTRYWRWIPLRRLLALDKGSKRQTQVMPLLPVGRWWALCLVRRTTKVIDRSRPGGREHTSPNAKDVE